jgi:hypothetical protein
MPPGVAVPSTPRLGGADLMAQSQILELKGGTRAEDRRQVARRVVGEMSIGENYERNITPICSNISRFSRGTMC